MSIEEGKQEQAPAKRNSRIVTLPKEDINQMLNLMNQGNSRTVVHNSTKASIIVNKTRLTDKENVRMSAASAISSSLVALPHTRNDEQPTIKMRNLI